MSQGDLAKALRHEVQWVKRRESGEYDPAPDLPAIAHVTQVPLVFLEQGWDALEGAGDPSLLERIDALEEQMRTIYRVGLNRTAAALAEEIREEAEGSPGGRSTDRED